MKRHTQVILYHLLPVVFWLLAIGGSLVPFFLSWNVNYLWGYLPAFIALLCVWIIGSIRRHTNSVEQCFQVALLLGIASYWLPTILFLIIPIWAYLIYQNLFSFRSFLATLIGLAVIAIWAAIFIRLRWIDNPWMDFFAKENAWGWIPTGALLLAWLASTIARQILRVR